MSYFRLEARLEKAKKFWARHSVALTIALLMVLAIWIRSYYLEAEGNPDEETYLGVAVWLKKGRLRGVSGLNEGLGVTNSPLREVYRGFGCMVDDESEPYLDQPLGYIALEAAWTSLFGETLYACRLLAILLSAVDAVLIYLIARRLFSNRLGFLAGLSFALAPPVVIQTYQAFLDHGVIFWSLLSLYALLKHLDSPSTPKLMASSVCAGLAAYSKTTGLAAVGMVFLLLALEHRYRDAIIAAAVGLAIFSIYPITGLLLHRELFLTVMKAYSYQIWYPGYVRMLEFMFECGGFSIADDVNSWLDPYMLIAWMGVSAIAMYERNRARYVMVPLACFVLMLLMRGSGNHTGVLSWYLMSLFPWLSMGYGYAMDRALSEPWFGFQYVVFNTPALLRLIAVFFPGCYAIQWAVYSPMYWVRMALVAVVGGLLLLCAASYILYKRVVWAAATYGLVAAVFLCYLIAPINIVVYTPSEGFSVQPLRVGWPLGL